MNTILNYWKNKRIRNWGVVIITILILGLLISRAFAQTPGNTSSTKTEAKVVSVSVGETVSASGSLQAQPFASLKWQTSGVVEKVNVKAGDLVKKGDTLAALQPSSTSSNIVSAQADLVQAQKNLTDLLNSDTDRAQAAVDLKTAQDAYKKAYNYRVELNSRIWQKWVVYKYIMGQQIPVTNWHYGYVDSGTIADADRDLALKKAELDDAQRKYDRLKDGPNTQDVAADQAKVDAAQMNVNALYIIAPFGGQVLSVDNQAEDTVSNGDLAINLGDMSHLFVDTQVDESDIANIKVGNPMTATLDAVPGITLGGRVSAVNPVGETISGLVKYKVRVDFDQSDRNSSLPLGTTANVTIQVKQPSPMLAVPVTMVQNDSQGEYVLVAQSDGTTKRVTVVSGSIVGNLVTVTGDLKEGETLATPQTGNKRIGPFGG